MCVRSHHKLELLLTIRSIRSDDIFQPLKTWPQTHYHIRLRPNSKPFFTYFINLAAYKPYLESIRKNIDANSVLYYSSQCSLYVADPAPVPLQAVVRVAAAAHVSRARALRAWEGEAL